MLRGESGFSPLSDPPKTFSISEVGWGEVTRHIHHSYPGSNQWRTSEEMEILPLTSVMKIP